MLAVSVGVAVLLVLVIAFPTVLMSTAIYTAPRAMTWARARAERKRQQRSSQLRR